jgi:hypothetical protein
MLEKLNKYAGLIPLAAIIIYILGYITLNSYLQSYGINENVALDFNILKLGIVIAVIIGPIILLCYSDFKLGDYTNTSPDISDSVINTLHDALGYTIFYSLALGNLLIKVGLDLPGFIMTGFLLIGFILNKVKIKPAYSKMLKGIFLIIPFFTLSIVVISQPNSTKGYIYLLQLGVFLSCALLRIFNKEGTTYQISKIGTIITSLFFSASLLGAFIIDKVPAEYGGEKIIAHTYYLNPDEIDKIKATALKEYIKKDNAITIQEVYSNTDMYFFKTPSKKVVIIPKSYIVAQEINMPTGYSK